MDPALQVLIDRHYIQMPDIKTGKIGRPGKPIFVNPMIKIV